MAGERLGISMGPHKCWAEEGGGVHVFAVALYSLMKQENYPRLQETFRDFLLKKVRSGEPAAGLLKQLYGGFTLP